MLYSYESSFFTLDNGFLSEISYFWNVSCQNLDVIIGRKMVQKLSLEKKNFTN